MSIIDKLLGKRGVEKVEDLSIEEQTQVQKWSLVLRGDSVTVPMIKEFCLNQIRIIEANFASKAGVYEENVYMKASLNVYLNLLKLIEAPEAERASLEKYLTQLIES